MIEAGRAPGRRLAPAAFPGVEPDVVVVAAGRDKGGLGAIALNELEAEDAAIKGERAVEIGDLEVDMANAHAGIDRRGGFRRGSGRLFGNNSIGQGRALLRTGSVYLSLIHISEPTRQAEI